MSAWGYAYTGKGCSTMGMNLQNRTANAEGPKPKLEVFPG